MQRVLNIFIMDLLKNEVALITGAAQGIGLATARLMLQHGGKVGRIPVLLLVTLQQHLNARVGEPG